MAQNPSSSSPNQQFQWRFATGRWPGSDSPNVAVENERGRRSFESTSTQNSSEPEYTTTSPLDPWDDSWLGCQNDPSSVAVEAKGPSPNKTQKRKEQNRASQRAFRHRKETHVKHLEVEIEELRSSYESLLQSFAQQTEQVSHLTAQLEHPAPIVSGRQFHMAARQNVGGQPEYGLDLFPFEWIDPDLVR